MAETFPINDFTNDWNGFLDKVEGSVDWNDPELKEVVRFRLLGDRDFPLLDVSYCYGRLRDGTYVSVNLPFYQLPKRTWKTEIIKYAKQDGVYAKGLGMFDNVSLFI